MTKERKVEVAPAEKEKPIDLTPIVLLLVQKIQKERVIENDKSKIR